MNVWKRKGKFLHVEFYCEYKKKCLKEYVINIAQIFYMNQYINTTFISAILNIYKYDNDMCFNFILHYIAFFKMYYFVHEKKN